MLFYDFEVFMYDWLVVFKYKDNYKVIVNDKNELEKFIKENKKILVGFNNYYYDDVILKAILTNQNPYKISQKLINGQRNNLYSTILSLDVKQELLGNISLKSIEANLGDNIIETAVDFNINRPLTNEEINRTIQYCKNDVDTTEKIFKLREDYFQSKLDLIKAFKLDLYNLKKTRARLSALILNSYEIKQRADRLHCHIIPEIDQSKIPDEVLNFYNQIVADYKAGGNFEDIEKRSLKINLAGVEHVFAFGGLHGAIKNYKGEGHYLNVDVSSFYPNLMINFNFLSRASRTPELFEDIKNIRMDLKKKKDPKQGIYKIVLNSTYGAMKDQYNNLFDPLMANNICINGQLILTELIYNLSKVSEIIQSNTDGVLIKYKNIDDVKNIINDFEHKFKLKLDMDKIKKVIQRDVNNYIVEFENGKIKAKGEFGRFGDYKMNNLSIISIALKEYYINNKTIEETVLNEWKNNNLIPFQIICKMGRTFQKMVYEYDGEIIETQKVNRAFATNNEKYGGIYKVKNDKLNKIPNTSNNMIIFNENIKKFNKNNIDLNFYIELIKKKIF